MAALIYGVWVYILSFQTVTFKFDDTLGYVEIQGSDTKKLYPKNNQAVRLKKGEYTLQNIGQNITKNTRKLTLDESVNSINISFSYTREHLANLYASEADTIRASLLDAYPKITELYEIKHDKLYRKGDIFGASLVAKNQNDDNADTLKVLMKKQKGSWIVASKPPAPLLSAPLYPDVDIEILRAINKQ